MQTPKLKIAGNIEIVRERSLPVPGEVLVSIGDSVNENDVVLRTSLKSELVNLMTREVLGLGDEEISNYFKVKEGQKVVEGDVLFKRPGLFGYFSEELKSTASGTIEFVDSTSGFIGIRPEPRIFEVKAYLRGEVVEIKEGKSIKIQSKRSGLLQGVFGRGRECSGILTYVDSLTEPLTGSPQILAYPGFISRENLLFAVKSGVRGLLVSSACSSLVNISFEEFLIPSDFVFMVVDGFGEIKPSDKLISFLKKARAKHCSLSGQVQIRAGAIRPELIVHGADESEPLENESREFDLSEGSEVRVVRGAQIGEVGILKSFTSSQIDFPSGIKCLGAQVIVDGEIKLYPLQNIEAV